MVSKNVKSIHCKNTRYIAKTNEKSYHRLREPFEHMFDHSIWYKKCYFLLGPWVHVQVVTCARSGVEYQLLEMKG